MMMGQLTKILTDKGFTIPVVPELDTLTVGKTLSHSFMGGLIYLCKSLAIFQVD